MTSFKGGMFLPAWHLKRVLGVIVALFLVNGALFPLIYQRLEETLWNLGSDSDSFTDHGLTWSSPAWSLVEATRAAITQAGGVPSTSLSSAQAKAWDVAHPLLESSPPSPIVGQTKKSTYTGEGRKKKEPSDFLRVLFSEYANLHRTCTHGGDIAYVTKLFKSRDVSDRCQFLVVEFGPYGVGNRLLWLVSSFLYALLTQRVLLIDTRSTIHSLLCEPFPGSSWQLPETFPYSSEKRWTMPAEFQQGWDVWENSTLETDEGREDRQGLKDLSMEEIERETRETKALIQERMMESQRDGLSGDKRMRSNMRKMSSIEKRRKLIDDELPRPPVFHHVQANDGWSPNPRFFCNNEQERLNTVKWVSLNSGCLYFLPDLFALPSVQPALEELFPDRDPLTHLVRRLTLPANHIWKLIRRFYTADFEKASKVVGMQVRYREGASMYKTLNNIVNTRINRCATQHSLIPSPDDLRANASGVHDRDGPVLIFIASLYSGLGDHLRTVYDETMLKGLKILQLSTLGFQSFDPDADNQAFTEIICLSLSDDLMTSPQSTYGQIAQAYGGLQPWLIQFDPQASSDCVRGQSSDACYQFPVANFVCPFNKQFDGKAMAEVVPYLKPCQDSDGLQLVPPWTKNSSLSVI